MGANTCRVLHAMGVAALQQDGWIKSSREELVAHEGTPSKVQNSSLSLGRAATRKAAGSLPRAFDCDIPI